MKIQEIQTRNEMLRNYLLRGGSCILSTSLFPNKSNYFSILLHLELNNLISSSLFVDILTGISSNTINTFENIFFHSSPLNNKETYKNTLEST